MSSCCGKNRTLAVAEEGPEQAENKMSDGTSGFVISTEMGAIQLFFAKDAAPKTCEYYAKAIGMGLFDSQASFYRSDFVIQCGLHGSSVKHPDGDLQVNETHTQRKISNGPGTAAVAHWDVPDCGNTEFFINLKQNSHLDDAYGGYCVFAQVSDSDKNSWDVIAQIRDIIKQDPNKTVKITGVALTP